MTEILNERPPIWDKVIEAGLRFNPESVLFAYDGKIWNPSGSELASHLIAHEAVHLAQQDAYQGGMDAWWGRYIVDPYFRIDQEVEAYATQYAFICGYVKDRNQRSRVLGDLARYLSGPMYGEIISHAAAMRMIKAQLI